MPQRSKRPVSCESWTITYQGLRVIIAAIETYGPTSQLGIDHFARGARAQAADVIRRSSKGTPTETARVLARSLRYLCRCQLWTMGKSAACLGVPAAKVPTSFDELSGGTRGETQTSQFQKDTSASPPGFEARAAACSRRPVSLGRNMSKRNRTVFDEGNLEAMVRLREQDEKFCQALRAAIQRGRESRPTGVSTEPCTQRPILNYTRPD
jgi:hypothetical protein